MPSPKLPPALSIYLDLVRFLAAIAVLAAHFLAYPIARETPSTELGLIGHAGYYGEAAVIIFFVLSGYVIAYVVDKREGDALSYSVSRFARLYSVVLIAIVLTLFFDSMGSRLWPNFYSLQSMPWFQPSVSGYVSSFFFINEYQAFDWVHIGPGTNGVFWSLSFEATYYVWAGLILFAPRGWAIAGTAVVALFAGPTIVALAPVWAAGFFLYRFQHKLRVPAPAIAFAGTAFAIFVFSQFASRLPTVEQLPHGPSGAPLNIAAYYLTAALFVVNLQSAYQLFQNGFPLLERYRSTIRYLSKQTFPLYAIHYPILCFFSASNPFPHFSVLGALYMLVPVAIVVALATNISDRLRDAMRSSISQRLARSSPV